MIKIKKNLYQGDLDDLDLTTLRISSIQVVIVVAEELYNVIPQKIEWNDNDNTFIWKYNIRDDSSNQEDEIVNILDDIESSILGKNKTLVLCSAGISRSPYVIARYLNQVDGLTMGEAYEYLKKLNPAVDDRTPLMGEMIEL